MALPGRPDLPQQPHTPAVGGAVTGGTPLPATVTPTHLESGGGAYLSVGALSAEQLLTGSSHQFDHLQEQVVRIREWLQDHLTAQGRAEEIAEARLDPSKRAAMTAELDRILIQYMSKESVVRGPDRGVLMASVINEVLGLGPIEPLWSDHRITEVMVNGPGTVFVEIEGKLVRAPGAKFRDRDHLLEVCQQILMPLNRRVDQKTPLADGRLSDGSRVNIAHYAVAPGGPLLTIRRFPETVWTLKDLVENGSITPDMAAELAWLVYHKSSTVVVGGTGSGKALDVATPIPTPDGFTPMGDLRVGDSVLDENGGPCRVTAVFDQPDGRTCYEVSFTGGAQVVADADHNWFVYRTSSLLEASEGVFTTEQIHNEMYPLPQAVFRVPAVTGGPAPQPERFIEAITPVASRPVRCITVDSPSHLFLAGEGYVPTHNTSLLNALSSCIPRGDRVVTVEDSLELRLHPDAHVAAMEARPASASGEGEVRIRDLVKNALRMRPDRIVVGEVRDAAALDMLQAMNTGHEGSLTTVHANGADEALNRLAVLVAQGGEIPENKVQWLIGDAVDLMVLQRRYEDGSRRVQGIYEVPSMRNSTDGQLKPIPLWEWEQTGTDDTGTFIGHYVKRNDISEELTKMRRLHQARRFNLDDVYRMSELPSEMRKDH